MPSHYRLLIVQWVHLLKFVVGKEEATMKWLMVLLLAVVALQSSHAYPRKVTKVLTINNDGAFGDWKVEEFCPRGSFVTSFQLKVINYNIH